MVFSMNVGRFERFEAFLVHFQLSGGFCLEILGFCKD
jgi:hypothetical protein